MPMPFRLTQHGRGELIVATAALVGLCVLIAALAVRVSPWLLWLMVLPLAVWLTVVWFFRDPDRCVPPAEALWVSPADGRVTDITQIGADSLLGRDGVQIGIFMNIFDVHVNRSPCEGRIERIAHKPGAFADARDPTASQYNESAAIFLTHSRDDRDYPVVVRQIAGLVARRIVTDLTAGQSLARGQRIGMIKFGSRVEVLLPNELLGQLSVAIGQRVKAGQSALLETRKAATI